MPQAVTHILIPLIAMSLFKDWYDKKTGKKFPLHYVLIAGLAGLLPDLDIIAFWGLGFFGFTLEQIHRTYLHTIFFPLAFFALYLICIKCDIKLTKKNLKLDLIFLMIAIGTSFHLLLDAIFQGYITPFYPILPLEVGLNIFRYLPEHLKDLAAASMDAILLFIWLIYLEWKHKISDFI